MRGSAITVVKIENMSFLSARKRILSFLVRVELITSSGRNKQTYRTVKSIINIFTMITKDIPDFSIQTQSLWVHRPYVCMCI